MTRMKESKNKNSSSERETGEASLGAEGEDVNGKTATSFNRLSSRDLGRDCNRNDSIFHLVSLVNILLVFCVFLISFQHYDGNLCHFITTTRNTIYSNTKH